MMQNNIRKGVAEESIFRSFFFVSHFDELYTILCIALSKYTKYILHFVSFNDIGKINAKKLELFISIVYNILKVYWYQILIHNFGKV